MRTCGGVVRAAEEQRREAVEGNAHGSGALQLGGEEGHVLPSIIHPIQWIACRVRGGNACPRMNIDLQRLGAAAAAARTYH